MTTSPQSTEYHTCSVHFSTSGKYLQISSSLSPSNIFIWHYLSSYSGIYTSNHTMILGWDQNMVFKRKKKKQREKQKPSRVFCVVWYLFGSVKAGDERKAQLPLVTDRPACVCHRLWLAALNATDTLPHFYIHFHQVQQNLTTGSLAWHSQKPSTF